MGVYVLAIAVWLGSISLYGAAFFFPEVHRRHDFFWSGVGAFYGLVLWFSAVQTSPTELLGHLASVVLLGWLGWQTLSLRRKRTPLDLQTPITQDSWPALGQQIQQSGLDLLRATPLRRWLPEPTDTMKPGDPAIAVAEIRASSLKDVDYEFVDELAPDPRPAAIAPALPIPPAAESNRATVDRPAQRPRRSPPPPATGAPAGASATTRPREISLGARFAGLQTWLGDVIKAKKAPQPKRAVIEIPPRPSSLDRNKTQRAVIDIPPRPSPLDRNKAKPPEGEVMPPATVTIVDTAAVESEGEGVAPEPAATPSPQPDSAQRPAPPAEPSESNWDDDDSNWLDE